MHFGKKNKKFIYSMMVKNRKLLSESNLERDLGILASKNISWEDKVNSAVSKTSCSLGLI